MTLVPLLQRDQEAKAGRQSKEVGGRGGHKNLQLATTVDCNFGVVHDEEGVATFACLSPKLSTWGRAGSGGHGTVEGGAGGEGPEGGCIVNKVSGIDGMLRPWILLLILRIKIILAVAATVPMR
jgi:hypothetical protein